MTPGNRIFVALLALVDLAAIAYLWVQIGGMA